MYKLIYVVDDEEDILNLVAINLKKAGFLPYTFLNAQTFFQQLDKKKPDLIILDIMLPDSDGLEICKYLRSNEEYRDIPIIFLTARASEVDKVVGLELGGDDYIVKPFSAQELTARIKALLRRSTPSDSFKNIIEIKDRVKLYLDKYEVYVDNKRVELTTTEFKILKLLAQNRGRVFSREDILDYLWGNEKAVLDRTIDVHIKHLREKIGELGNTLIRNIRGVGYKMVDDTEL